MARSKVMLQYITNDNARKVTYRKRVKGLVKKTEELQVLCGVEACTVVYSPYDEAPVVFPSNSEEVRQIMLKYKGKPDMDVSMRRVTQETFLKQSLAKSEEKFLKLQRKNREMQMENVITELMTGKPVEQVRYEDVGDLFWVVGDRLRAITHQIRVLEGPDNNASLSAPSQPPFYPHHL